MYKHSIKELSTLLAERKVSSEELTRVYLKRIEAYNPALNAVIHVSADSAIEQARAVDIKRQKQAPLSEMAGIPVLNKDIFCCIDSPTTCCSKSLENYHSPFDATMVKNCRNADMVFLGKCNMDEFAMGGSNENSVHGPCHNPWNTEHVSGGSSGGSAVAAAARLAPVVTGSDTGGSIRQPAAYCGITGLKPSYGVVSRYGMIAFASSLDQAGPMASSAEDCAIMLKHMASFDPNNDMTSVKQKSYDYTRCLDQNVRGLKVGLPKEFFESITDATIEKCLQDAIDTYKEMGVEFIEVTLPDIKHCVSAYYTIAPCEASSNLARFDGNIYGHRSSEFNSIEQMYERSRKQGFGEEVKRRIMMGTYALSTGYSDDYYEKAQNIRNLIRHDFDEAWRHVDMIMAPTTTSTAFKIGEYCNDPIKMYLQDVYTIPVNLSELPALSMPIGFCNSMPVGMQIIGKKWHEAEILGCAHQFQNVTDWHSQIPKICID